MKLILASAVFVAAQMLRPAWAFWSADPSYQGETLGSARCVGEPVMVGEKQVFQLFSLNLGSESGLAKFTQQGRLDVSWAVGGTARNLPGTPSQVLALPDGRALLLGSRAVSGGAFNAAVTSVYRLTERGTLDTSYGPVSIDGTLHSSALDRGNGLVVVTVKNGTTLFTRLDAAGRIDAAFTPRELPINTNAETPATQFVIYAWSLLEGNQVEVGLYPRTTRTNTGRVFPRVRRYASGTSFQELLTSDRLIPAPGMTRYIADTVKVDAGGAVTLAVAAFNQSNAGVVRYLASGDPDLAFGDDGVVFLFSTRNSGVPINSGGVTTPTALVMREDGGWSVFVEDEFSTGGFFPFIWDAAGVHHLASPTSPYAFSPLGSVTTQSSARPFERPFNGAHQDDGSIIAALPQPAGCKLQRLTTDTPRVEASMVEYYHPALDHYFLTLDGLESEILDANPGYGWKRTGRTFGAWMPLAIPGGSRTCRFYGDLKAGPNSHFYIPDGPGCEGLRQLEASTPIGTKAWRLEGRTFTVREAIGGACPANLDPVYRTYNRGFERGIDTNHRYTDDTAVADSMVAQGWVKEGIAFCLPPRSTRSLRSREN